MLATKQLGLYYNYKKMIQNKLDYNIQTKFRGLKPTNPQGKTPKIQILRGKNPII